MKTLLFTLEYPPQIGGVADYYENLVEHWPDNEEIVVLDNIDNELIVKKLPLLKWLPAIWQLYRLVKTEKINHILVGQILPLGVAALIVARWLPVKYSVILHGLDFNLAVKKPRKRWLTEKILARAEKIICANSYTAGKVKEFVPANAIRKVKVVNPGVDQGKGLRVEGLGNGVRAEGRGLREKYNLQDKLVLLTVGRLIERKGVDMVLAALPMALKEAPELVYVIVGDGPVKNDLLKEIRFNDLSDKVILLDNVTDKERDQWYGLCDIFIMPARAIGEDVEGFGIVYLEANLHGKPVIAGASGGVGDAVVDNLNGLLVDPEDPRAIAQAIVKLANFKGVRERLGEAGRQRAVEQFNWQGQAGKLFRYITE